MFKPMLASPADLSTLTYPKSASPKLDGVRAIVRAGVVYSRSNKRIPNKAVQALFGHLNGYDGELIVGEPTSSTVYRETVSTVMGRDKPADSVTFYIFDTVHFTLPGDPYYMRRLRLKEPSIMDLPPTQQVQLHTERYCTCLSEVLKYEEECIELGYEGLILRDPLSYYKFGRSTTREQIMLKVKRFQDAEARVIGMEERLHNGNAATTNELGRTARSSHQENKSGRGDLGALICEYQGGKFNIGTGFTDYERAEIWDSPHIYLHRMVKFKFFPIGVKEAPRHPVFLGWRSPLDL